MLPKTLNFILPNLPSTCPRARSLSPSSSPPSLSAPLSASLSDPPHPRCLCLAKVERYGMRVPFAVEQVFRWLEEILDLLRLRADALLRGSPWRAWATPQLAVNHSEVPS